MEYVVFLNEKKVLRSKSMTECVERCLMFINDVYEREGVKGAIGSKMLYIDAVRDIMRNIDAPLDNEVVLFFNNKIEIHEYVPEKKYVVTCSKTYDDSVDNDDIAFLDRTDTYICTEKQLSPIVRCLREEIERMIESFYYDETFENRLGNSVDCMVDNETQYELYDRAEKAFYKIMIEEMENVGE